MASVFAQSMFDALPEYIREADTSGDLLAYLSGVGDTLDPAALVIRSGGDLGDPALCPRTWLDWLAAVGGVDTTVVDWANLPDADRRDWLADYSNRRRGTVAAIEGVVGRTLTGSQTVQVIERDGGDPWAMRVVVYTSQVVDIDDTTAAARAETPAWLVLTVQSVTATTWQQLTDEALTWTDVEGIGTWADVQAWTP